MPRRPDDVTTPTTRAGRPVSGVRQLRAADVGLVLDLAGLPRVLHGGADLGPLDLFGEVPGRSARSTTSTLPRARSKSTEYGCLR